MPRDQVQTAQAPAPAGGGAPIGRVDTLTGSATAQRVDGSTVTLAQGDPVFAKDLVTTQAGAKLAIVFADKTTFALGESGQLRLDTFVYNPSAKTGKLAASMLKGAFAFVSGDIAATEADAMTVRTPVGTIGIRGTFVQGKVEPDGESTFSAMPDPSGAPSVVSFTNGAGIQILTDNTVLSVKDFFSAPSVPTALAGSLGAMGDLASLASSVSLTVNPPAAGAESHSGAPAPAAAPPAASGSADGGGHISVTVSLGGGGGGGGSGLPTVTFNPSFNAIAPLQPAYYLTSLGRNITDDDFFQTTTVTSPPPPPPPPPPSNYLGTLAKDNLKGTAAAELFDFKTIPNSLQSGDVIDGGGGGDTLSAAFTAPFTIDGSLSINNVARIEMSLAGGPDVLDAAGINGPATIVATGTGALTVANLHVNFDGSGLANALNVSASSGGIAIIGTSGNDTITTAAHGSAAGAATANAVTNGFPNGVTNGFTNASPPPPPAPPSSTAATGGATIAGGAGSNVLLGGAGDTVDYSAAPGPVSMDFATGQASNGYGGTDAVTGVTGFIGSNVGPNVATLGPDMQVVLANVQTIHGSSVAGAGGLSATSSGDVVFLTSPGAVTVDRIDVLVGSTGTDSITVTDAPAAANAENLMIAAGGGGGGDSITFVNAGNDDDLFDFASVTYQNLAGTAPNLVNLLNSAGSSAVVDFQGASAVDVLAIGGIGSGDQYLTVSGAEQITTSQVLVGGSAFHLTIAGAPSASLGVSLGGAHDSILFATTAGTTATVNGGYAIGAGSFGDTLTITTDHAVISGGAGNDVLSVTAPGYNTIQGSAGSNGLFTAGMATVAGGGLIYDVLSYASAPAGVTVDLAAGSAAANGFGGSDTLTASNGLMTGFGAVIGTAFDDTINLGTGYYDPVADLFQGAYVFAGAGNNVISASGAVSAAGGLDYRFAPGAVNANLLSGIVANGYGGTDTVSGSFPILIGSAGNDTITGNGTLARVYGGGGIDTFLAGGQFSNTIVSGVAHVGLDATTAADNTAVNVVTLRQLDVQDVHMGGASTSTLILDTGGASLTLGSGTGHVFVDVDNLTLLRGTGAAGTFWSFKADGTEPGFALDASTFYNSDTLVFDASAQPGGSNFTVTSTAGRAVVLGGGGDDAITLNYGETGGGTLLHVVWGGGGNNTLVGGGFSDDVLVYEGTVNGVAVGTSTGVNITLDGVTAGSNGQGGTDIASGFGKVYLTHFNDTIKTGAAPVYIDGGGVNGHAGIDQILAAGDVTVDGAAQITSTTAGALTVTIDSFSADATPAQYAFDFTSASISTLTLNVGGTTPTALNFSDGSSGSTLLTGLDTLVLQSGSYNLHFDDPALGSSQLVVDTHFLPGTANVTLDAMAHGGQGGSLKVQAGAAHETVYGTGNGLDLLDYAAAGGPGIALSITAYDDLGGASNGIVSGMGIGAGNQAGDQFTGIGGIYATPGSQLTITASGIGMINLQSAFIDNGGGCGVVGIGGFDYVQYSGASDVHMVSDIKGVQTLIGGQGNDLISAQTGGFVDGNGSGIFGDNNELDVYFGAGVVTVDALDASHGGIASGSVTAGAISLGIAHFDTVLDGTMQFSGDPALSLVVASTVTNITEINLAMGCIDYDGGANEVMITGFNSATYLGSADIEITSNFTSGRITGNLIGGSGNDTIHVRDFSIFADGNGTGSYGDHNTLDLNWGPAVGQVTIDHLDSTQGGITAGTWAFFVGGGSMAHFDSIVTTLGTPLIIGAGATNVSEIDIAHGEVEYDGGASSIHISGFGDYIIQAGQAVDIKGDANGNILTLGSGGGKLTGRGGADILTSGSSASNRSDFDFEAATDSSVDTGIDTVMNFHIGVDRLILDSAGATTFAGARTGPDVATAFAADAAHQASYWIDTTNNFTYVHVAGAGGGYSSADLLVAIQGQQPLTSANIHHA